MPGRFVTTVSTVVLMLSIMLGTALAILPTPSFASVDVVPCSEGCPDGTFCGPSGTCQQPSSFNNAKIPVVKDLNKANEAAKEQKPSLLNNADAVTHGTAGALLGLVAGNLFGNQYNYNGDLLTGMGAIGGMNRAVAALFREQPASAEVYIADALNSVGIAQPAYAQGIGFASLNPILQTWKVFRNIAYLFFVLIFLAIGFMIMFRQKMGQAAITAQQAIPQIILALIFVTFSYAIAGLLIDAMYLLMFFMVAVFGQEASLIDKNFLQLGVHLITEGVTRVDIIGDFIDGTLSSLSVLSEVIEIVSEVIFALILGVAILIGMFRLFFELLKTYVTIVASIAFAPLFLMLGAIPGRSVFTGWIKGLIGNLAAFPTVLGVMIVFNMLVENRGQDGAGFIPPYLFGSGTAGVIPALIGLGLILALPEVVKKVKEALGARDSFGWLTDAAFKAMKRGDVSVPLLTGGAGGAYGMYRGLSETAGTDKKLRDRISAVRKSTGKYAKGGFDFGISRFLKPWQRLWEGRVFQVEDMEKLLSRIAEGKTGEDGSGGTSTPERKGKKGKKPG